jgi:hypothetical protein
MGNLSVFNLPYFMHQYNLLHFVETGTLRGETLDYVKYFTFKKLYSMEIMKSLYDECIAKYKSEDKIALYHGDTSKDFHQLLKDIPEEENTLFWLDAHFPGAEGCGLSYDHSDDVHARIPLQQELEQIKECRSLDTDVFIIDDLRVYEDGPYEDGNWEDRNKLGGNGIEFIEDFFEETHILQKLYNHQGYLLGVPK